MPFDSGVGGMFYRIDMLKEAGNPSDGGFFRLMLQSSGKWYFDKDGNVDIKNNPALVEAIKIQKRMYSEGFRKPTSGWTEWVSVMNSGDVASVSCLSTMGSYLPSLNGSATLEETIDAIDAQLRNAMQ